MTLTRKDWLWFLKWRAAVCESLLGSKNRNSRVCVSTRMGDMTCGVNEEA